VIMRRNRILLIGVAAIVATMLTAPDSRADENQYLAQIADALNGKLTSSQAVTLGDTACQAVRSAMANGMTLGKARSQADEAVGYAQQDMGLNLTMADGMHLVDAAVDQLC